MAAIRFLLASIRQRVLVAPFVETLREKLRVIAERGRGVAHSDTADAATRAKLAELSRQQAELNLALAQTLISIEPSRPCSSGFGSRRRPWRESSAMPSGPPARLGT